MKEDGLMFTSILMMYLDLSHQQKSLHFSILRTDFQRYKTLYIYTECNKEGFII